MKDYERSPIVPMTEEQKKDFELQIKNWIEELKLWIKSKKQC